MRGKPRMQTLRPRAVRQKLQGACGHAAGDADGGEHLLFTQTQKLCRRNRRTEYATGWSRMEAQFVMRFRLQRHSQARCDFVSGNDRRHELADVNVRMNFTQRNGGRKHHDAGMEGTRLMRIVEFQAVSGCAIRQRRIFRRCSGRGADNRTDAGRRRAGKHPVNRLRRIRKRAGDCNAEIIKKGDIGCSKTSLERSFAFSK